MAISTGAFAIDSSSRAALAQSGLKSPEVYKLNEWDLVRSGRCLPVIIPKLALPHWQGYIGRQRR